MARKPKYIKAGAKKSLTMICRPEHSLNEPCPKCGKIMQTRTHKKITSELLAKKYYYAYWCFCVGCNRIQHYDDAKVLNPRPNSATVWKNKPQIKDWNNEPNIITKGYNSAVLAPWE